MADIDKTQSPLAYLKDISAFARDVAVTVVVVACLVHPAGIKSFLHESGLNKLTAFGFSVEIPEEKEKLAEAQKTVSREIVQATSSGSGDPPPEASNTPVDQNFKQTILAPSGSLRRILPTSGWVFLGRVDAGKSAWLDGGSTTTTASWPVAPDNVLTVKDDVYVRAVTSDRLHSSAPVATVAKVGDKLKVVEVQYSPAKAGGSYVWAKVALQSG